MLMWSNVCSELIATRGHKMSAPDPELAREAMFEVVENQMRDGDPPETRLAR